MTTKSQEAFEAWFRIESLAQNTSYQDAQYGYEAGIAYGRKQALEEAYTIYEQAQELSHVKDGLRELMK